MSDIKRFLNTPDAKMLKLYQVLMWVLFALIFVFGIIIDLGYYRRGEYVELPLPLMLIGYALIIQPFANFLAVTLATFFSGIASRTAYLQAGIIAYINDGVKKRVRLNYYFLCIIAAPVVIHRYNIYDDASFIAERKILVRFELWLLIIYPILGVVFTVLNLFFGKGLWGTFFNMMTINCAVWTLVQSFLNGKSDTTAKNYLRAKFDDLFMIANLNGTTSFATKFKFDPEPVRAYKINGICKELGNPAVDPDSRLAMCTVDEVFVEYVKQGRTDFPKIIADYLEYYYTNGDRLFCGKTCTQICYIWKCVLYYLALTGRREAAVNEYNKRATYMLPSGKYSQFINGSLRYILFNEDYSLWLLDRKNMYPEYALFFLVKYFEIPYINEAQFIIELHKLIWEKQVS
ncbi:MAG: hypothetical protein LBM59_00250 [Ruminococcus sp.]|jgi:hypothetical protein|nr:hypothetical protein [Ruminococcus sp.]